MRLRLRRQRRRARWQRRRRQRRMRRRQRLERQPDVQIETSSFGCEVGHNARRSRVDGTWQEAALSIDRLRLPGPAVRCGYHDQGRHCAAGSKESPYATRDKLLREHCISVHANKAKKAVNAVDSVGCANVLVMGTFSKDGVTLSGNSPATPPSRNNFVLAMFRDEGDVAPFLQEGITKGECQGKASASPSTKGSPAGKENHSFGHGASLRLRKVVPSTSSHLEHEAQD